MSWVRAKQAFDNILIEVENCFSQLYYYAQLQLGEDPRSINRGVMWSASSERRASGIYECMWAIMICIPFCNTYVRKLQFIVLYTNFDTKDNNKTLRYI